MEIKEYGVIYTRHWIRHQRLHFHGKRHNTK